MDGAPGGPSTSSQVTLRRCRYRDLPQVVAIEKESFTDPYSLFEFAAHLMSSRSKLVVACANQVVVGYVLAIHESRRIGQIQSIAVSRELRGRGIGTMLMSSAMEHLTKLDKVRLVVRRTNMEAIRLYRSFSFRESGRVVEGYYPNGEDAIEFEWISPKNRE